MELHALTLAAHSYVLLLVLVVGTRIQGRISTGIVADMWGWSSLISTGIVANMWGWSSLVCRSLPQSILTRPLELRK